MKKKIFPAKERGSVDFGWLKANYSFSFANYYNPENVHFGKLRVLNDDTIQGGAGFPKHPHANMEIITIPLKGALAHEDSTGAKGVIRPGEVQMMSAGKGIEHSEVNYLKDGETKLLQIWIFPKENNVTPRYQQQYFEEEHRLNRWQPVVSNLHQGALDIHQDAVLSLAKVQASQEIEYNLNFEGNGLYLFVIDGEIIVNQQDVLKQRDALGLEEIDQVKILAKTDSNLLAIEVPMM